MVVLALDSYSRDLTPDHWVVSDHQRL